MAKLFSNAFKIFEELSLRNEERVQEMDETIRILEEEFRKENSDKIYLKE